jgi:hypothetical protein
MPVFRQSVLSTVCEKCQEDIHITLTTPINITEGQHNVEVIIRKCYVLNDGVTTAHDVFVNAKWDHEYVGVPGAITIMPSSA